MDKKAVIFGVTGQDGYYLSKLLLEKGYSVVGVCRRVSTTNTSRIDGLIQHEGLQIEQGDVTDFGSVYDILSKHCPDEVYNLAAQSHVGTSFNQPSLTWDITAKGCLNILEVIRKQSPSHPWNCGPTRFYQASSSEMFGDQYTINRSGDKFQNEKTAFNPQSPYAIAKLAAHKTTQLYRKAYGIHASCGILFNHESEMRGDSFVTKKITKYIGELNEWLSNKHIEPHDCSELEDDGDEIGFDASRFLDAMVTYNTFPKLKLGNLTACRDWGHAEDYVRAMWLMLQQDSPDDYVIATGETHTVEDFLIEAFSCRGFANHKQFVTQDSSLFRPSEVPYLKGDYSTAKEKLGWTPKISFKELVRRMVDYDIKGCQAKWKQFT